MKRSTLFAACVAVLVAAPGCEEPQARRVEVVDPAELCDSVDPDSEVWESTPWSDPACPWLEYPGKTALEIPHSLGRTPRAVLPYVSFGEDGSEPTIASGNATVVIEATDAWVTIANTTDQRFFLRLVLE